MDGPVQLFTLIPQRLRRALRLYCFESGVTTEAFVTSALAERLERLALQSPTAGRSRRSAPAAEKQRRAPS